MKRKLILISLLLLMTSYFTINTYSETSGIEVKLDQKEYVGLGDRMRIQIKAPELNLHSYSNEQLSIKVTSSEDPSGFSVNAVETKVNSGVFEVYLGFNMKGSDAKHKSIKVKSGAVVYVKYGDIVREAQWKAENMVLKFDKATYNGFGVQPVITLDDNDLNLQYNLAEEISVTVKSSSDPAGTMVKLVEKSADSGVFTGTFSLDSAKPVATEKKLKIAYGCTITVSYNDMINTTGASVTQTASAVWKTCTGTIKLSKSTITGLQSVVAVTVADQDLNLRTAYVDSTLVKVTSDTDPNGYNLTLYETGISSGVFTGDIKFSTSTTDAGKGTIKVNPSDKVFVEYRDALNAENVPNKIIASAGFSLAGAEITTSAKNDSGSGNSLDITISDPDADSTAGRDNIIATVGTGNNTNDLTLHLAETGNHTGKFKTTLYFTNNASNGQMLYMPGASKINIKYVDNTIPGGGSKDVTKTISWDFQSSIMSLDKQSYTGYNSSAKITLNNMELNNKPDEVEYIEVDIRTINDKKMEMNLKETGKDSGKFTGTLYFGEKTDSDANTIKMTGIDSITVTYTNKHDKFDVIECYADWTPQDGTLALNRTEYCGMSAPVVITVLDIDLSKDIAAKDTVKVKVKVPETSKNTEVRLTETGSNTGKFIGTLYINGGSPGIRINPGQTLEVTYTDEFTATGATDAERKATALWTGVSEAKISLDKAEYSGYNSYMVITLTDSDQNKYTDKRDSLEVSIKTLSYPTGKKYKLTETGANTGVFTLKLKLIKEASTSSALHVRDADSITVTFTDKRVSAAAVFSK